MTNFERIKAMNIETLSGILSNEDRLPAERHDILVWAYWHEHWQILKGYWCDYLEWRTHDGEALPCVTHWMPLLQPPKEC